MRLLADMPISHRTVRFLMGNRKLKVDLDALELAFDDRSPETSYYLDLATGEVVAVTDGVRYQLEKIYEEMPEEEEEGAFEEALRQRDLPDWMKDDVRGANRVETYGESFVEAPKTDSHEAYGDMEAFIETISDSRLRDRLEDAINRPKPFRRFKDILASYPKEEEQWFRFRDERDRQRILEWLEEEGIEPI